MTDETFYIPAKKLDPSRQISVYYISTDYGLTMTYWVVKKRRKFWSDKTVAEFKYESYERGKQLAIDLATTLEKELTC